MNAPFLELVPVNVQLVRLAVVPLPVRSTYTAPPFPVDEHDVKLTDDSVSDPATDIAPPFPAAVQFSNAAFETDSADVNDSTHPSPLFRSMFLKVTLLNVGELEV